MDRWGHLSHLDLIPRSETAVQESIGTLLTGIVQHVSAAAGSLDILNISQTFEREAVSILTMTYDQTRTTFFSKAPTPQYLSHASRVIYEYVRTDLRVPFHRGIVDHPTLVAEEQAQNGGKPDGSLRGKILGTMASEIYVNLRNGELHRRVNEAWMHVVSDESDGKAPPINGHELGNGH